MSKSLPAPTLSLPEDEPTEPTELTSLVGGERTSKNEEAIAASPSPPRLAWMFAVLGVSALGLGALSGRSSSGAASLTTIIGGKEAEPGEFPYYVELINDSVGGHWCGGSLIAPDLVLTAAHCDGRLLGFDVPVDSVLVGAVEDNEETFGAQRRKCVGWESHPEYNDFTTEWDFALCKLDEPVEIDESKVVFLLNEDGASPRPGQIVTSIGLGDIDPEPSISEGADLLRKVDLPVIDVPTCENRNAEVGVGGPVVEGIMFCTDDPTDREGTCGGDSGGPTVSIKELGDGRSLHTLLGLTSWGDVTCARGPDVNARVSAAVGWIRETANGDFENIPTEGFEEGTTKFPTFAPTDFPTVTNSPSSPSTIFPHTESTSSFPTFAPTLITTDTPSSPSTIFPHTESTTSFPTFAPTLIPTDTPSSPSTIFPHTESTTSFPTFAPTLIPTDTLYPTTMLPNTGSFPDGKKSKKEKKSKSSKA